MVEKERAIVCYNSHVPVKKDETKSTEAEVLPLETLSGPFGTVPELLFEKKGLILAIQQLLVSQK